jgi:hypothetical protein
MILENHIGELFEERCMFRSENFAGVDICKPAMVQALIDYDRFVVARNLLSKGNSEIR